MVNGPYSSSSRSSSGSRPHPEQNWRLPSNWNWTGFPDNPQDVILEHESDFPGREWPLPKRIPRRPAKGYWQDAASSEVSSLIGKSNATVSRVICQGKVLARKSEIINPRRPTHFEEKKILQELKHQHIVQLVGSYVVGDVYSCLFYPVAEMDLTAFMHYGRENESANWTRTMTEGLGCLSNALAYLHGAGIKHKDIKPANILVLGDIMILADFGSASKFSNAEEGSSDWGPDGMTWMYMPPEARNGKSHGRSADVFSLGLVFGEMVDYIYVTKKPSAVEQRRQIAEDNPRRPSWFEPQRMTPLEAQFLEYMPIAENPITRDEVRLLFSVMTALSPKKRPTARQVWEFFRDKEFDFMVGLQGSCRTCGRCCR
ncbi:kinase-like protein [Acephala macrosclerotiorum]|nr:kinase-like protein [Acephala macrosclerotiorum]